MKQKIKNQLLKETKEHIDQDYTLEDFNNFIENINGKDDRALRDLDYILQEIPTGNVDTTLWVEEYDLFTLQVTEYIKEKNLWIMYENNVNELPFHDLDSLVDWIIKIRKYKNE